MIKEPLRFVVQKHQATRLHYDFRLEIEGVLKSWAIPKGPSMNPKEKRLAMMVDDHDLSYRLFEGVISEGNYGGGSVIVWDEGSYSVLSGDLSKGRLTFLLDGHKLKGEFSLVRLRKAEENAWLLIKGNDADAMDKDILNQDKSVLSNRTLEALVNGEES